MATTGFDQSAVPRGTDSSIFVGEDEAGYGWLFFAGTVLGLAGVMRIVDALWAFHYKGALPDNLKDGVLGSDLKTYGWVWLGIGILLIASSVLVLAHSQFARIVGLVAVLLMTVSAMAWMPYYPIWALTYVAVGMIAIYALAAHGGRIAS
ncbi:MAG TPA: hypothetical protein VGJ03_15645 [Acidimicrobiales bacterium]|jgi:hypothetical protein